MDRRIIAIIAVLAIGLTAFAIPLEDSDAEPQSVIMSDKYIYHTKIEWKNTYYSYYTSVLYFNDGSENYKTMLQYLEDGKTPVLKDDRENLGGTVHLYKISKWLNDSILYINVTGGESLMLFTEEVKKPFNNTFFVKVGDTISVSASKVTDMYGHEGYAEIGTLNICKDTYTETAKISKEISISLETPGYYEQAFDPLFYYVTYDITGDSQPNGSANVFIVICTLVAVIGLGLLVVAAIKPKWSK